MKCLTILILFVSSAGWAAGFRSGSLFQSTAIRGKVTVTCQDATGNAGSTSAVYDCRDTVLDPGVYDYFIGPVYNSAARVRLHAVHDNGTTRDRVVDYDGPRGISKVAVNLWIRTLFQYPLLDLGKNQIEYTITDSLGRSLASGSFETNVARGAARVCQDTFYNSYDSTDCSSQYTVCQRYFQQFNNCR